MRNDEYRDVTNTLAVALTLWAGVVAAGTRSGVFLRLPGEVLVALAVFAVAFAAGVVTMDARVRAWLDRRGAQSAWLALAGVSVLLVAAGAGLAETPAVNPAAAPWAPILLFGAPLTLALAIAAVRAMRREAAGAVRPPASTAPALRRAVS